MNQDDIRTLIDKAGEERGSKSALARELGISPQRLNDWRSGAEKCPPEYVALIAHAANLPADQWLARAVLWRAEGKKNESALQEALGKCLRVTGAALALGFGAVAVEALWSSTMYRLVKLPRPLR